MSAPPASLVEIVARAIDNARNGIDDDSVGSMLYGNHRIDGTDWLACVEQVNRVCAQAATAALSALSAAGYAVVPREATEEMVEAGMATVEFFDGSQAQAEEHITQAYRAMVQATMTRAVNAMVAQAGAEERR